MNNFIQKLKIKWIKIKNSFSFYDYSFLENKDLKKKVNFDLEKLIWSRERISKTGVSC